MIEQQIGKKLVRMYENIDEIPIHLYTLMQEYSLLDYEIGSSLDDVSRLFEKMDIQIVEKNWDAVVQVRKNMHQTFYNMLTRTDNKALQYACMIYSIDGVQVTDYSHEALMKMVEALGKDGLTYGKVKNEAAASKKKSKINFGQLFPKSFRTSQS